MDICKVLNMDEITTICNLITGLEFRKYYQNNPKEYEKLKRGFRAKSLSNEMAVSIAVKNINKPFINSFVNSIVQLWLDQIADAYAENQKEYNNLDEALAQTLIDSFFVSDIELYYKLIGKEPSNDSIQSLYSRIAEIAKEREINALSNSVDDNKPTETESELRMNNQYSEELKLATQRTQELEEEVTRLQEELNSAETEIRHYQELQDYMDAPEDVIESDYDFISICEVRPVDYNGNQFLLRLADIKSDGSIVPFIQDDSQPKQFENRSLIFFKTGPQEEGTVATWEWRAIPNKNDPSKDYVESDFNKSLSPIEVHSLPGCESIGDIIEALKNGVNESINSYRVLFTTQRDKNHLYGVLCDGDQLIVTGKRVKLDDKAISLPMFSFRRDEVVYLANGKYYYGSIKLGMPKDVVRLKKALEIVKDIVLSRGSWNAFKNAGKTRSEWKIARDFYENMDTSSLLQEIADSCNCSISEAQEIYDDFKANVDDYIDSTTLDDDLLSAVIVGNDELMLRCKTLVKDEWEKENSELIEKNNKELTAANSELSDIRSEYSKYEKELKGLKAKIETEKKTATQVHEELNKQIQAANENAAEFLSKYALFNNAGVSCSPSKSSDSHSTSSKYVPAQALNNDDMDSNSSYQDVISTVSYELAEAGVISEFTHPLAAYLFSAYTNGVSVLLSGPNAEQIADAFSIGVFGTKPGIIDCSDEYDEKVLLEAYDDKADVVKIINPFSRAWIQRIPQLLGRIGGYCIGVYPFPEDLQIEPHSIFNYMMPINTEYFVDSIPTNKYTGGRISENYQAFVRKSNTIQQNPGAKELQVAPLLKTLISTIISDMSEMIDDSSSGYDVLFALLPLAQATNQVRVVIDLLNNGSLKVSSSVKDAIDNYFGESDE